MGGRYATSITKIRLHIAQKEVKQCVLICYEMIKS